MALALADGIRKRTGATLGLGVTGIAGPLGGTPEKPVGLVHIGIADERGPWRRRIASRAIASVSAISPRKTALDAVRRYYMFPRPAAGAA